MTNSTDTFKEEFWILLQPLETTGPSEDDSSEGQPKISPILIFFLFLALDAFIIAVFYFCYFMRTKTIKPRTEEAPVVDKPPPYQVAVLENMYPSVSTKMPDGDEESSIGELPSYDETVTRNTNLHLPQSHTVSTVCSDIDMTVKMT